MDKLNKGNDDPQSKIDITRITFAENIAGHVFLEKLLKKSKCHYLFYHKPTKSYVLMLKMKSNKSNETYDDDDPDNDYGRTLCPWKMDMQKTTSDVDAVEELNFDQWSDNLKLNNGRVLIKIEIDFNQCTIKSLSVGSIVMRDDKIKLIGYDHTRSAVIYDTLPSGTVTTHEFRMMRINDLVDQWKHVF